MNKSLLLLVVASALVLASCSESGENEVKNVITDTVSTNVSGTDTVSHTQAFKNFTKEKDGLIRGVKLNMSMEEVKKLEEGNLLEEETANQLDYMVDYDGLEQAEVNYLFDGNKKLNAIELHVYPKSVESQNAVFAEFDKYFTERVGAGVSSDSITKKYENKLEDLNVVLAKRGNAKIHDVNISISKNGTKPKA